MSRLPRSLLPAALANAYRKLLLPRPLLQIRVITWSAPRAINVTTLVHAIRTLVCAPTRRRLMALLVTMVTRVPKLTHARPEYVRAGRRRIAMMATLARWIAAIQQAAACT